MDEPTVFENDRRVAKERLLLLARLHLHGDEERPPTAGADLLDIAVREIAALEQEASRLDDADLAAFDARGSRRRRALRRRAKIEIDRSAELAACTKSYVLRGLEGLLRRRGVGLEFLEYVYASAKALPVPGWLPLDGVAPDRFTVEPVLGGEFDERLALHPRCLRFGDYAGHDDVIDAAVELYHATDDVGGWSRRRPGPTELPWWCDERKLAWWFATLRVLRVEGRPAHRTSGETNVSALFDLVRREAHVRRLDPIDQRTFTRWFRRYWLILTFNAPSPQVPPRRLVYPDPGNRRVWKSVRTPAHWVRGRGWVLDSDPDAVAS